MSPPDPEPSPYVTWAPPPVVPHPHGAGSRVDLVAHWYDDFGKQATVLAADHAHGWPGWHDWQWNRPDNDGDGVSTFGYDPARHPYPDFYAGDDARTLDWQCHWLAGAGIRAVNLGTAVFTSSGWESPAHPHHWMHQLFTAVPSFGSLGFVLGLPFDGSPDEAARLGDEVVRAYADFPGGYTRDDGGDRLAVVFCWDLGLLRDALDGIAGRDGFRRTKEFLRRLAAGFRGIGYDGVCVLARNAGPLQTASGPPLRAAGVLVLRAEYSGRYGSDASYDHAYARYAATAVFPTGRRVVPNVVTAAETVHPHPSGWTLRGSTPELFEQALGRAVASADGGGQPMVTIYNVSEWAEAGPGLLPQRRDGFAYLDAVRRVLTDPARPVG